MNSFNGEYSFIFWFSDLKIDLSKISIIILRIGHSISPTLLLLSNVYCEMNRKGRSHHSGQISRPITEKRFLPKSSNEYYRLQLLARTLAGFDLVMVPNVIIFVLRDIKGRIRSIVRRETAIHPSVGTNPGLARWKKMALPLFWILQRIFQSGINTMS